MFLFHGRAEFKFPGQRSLSRRDRIHGKKVQLQQVRGNQNFITLLQDACGLAQQPRILGYLRHKEIFTHLVAVFHGPPLNAHKKACASPGDWGKPPMGGTGTQEGIIYHNRKAMKGPPWTLLSYKIKTLKCLWKDSKFCHSQGTGRSPLLLWEGEQKQTCSPGEVAGRVLHGILCQQHQSLSTVEGKSLP